MKAPCLTVIGVWAERSWDVSVRYGVTCRSLTNSLLKLGGGEPACRRGSAVPSRLTCGYGRKPGLTCFFDLPSVVIGSHAFEVSRVHVRVTPPPAATASVPPSTCHLTRRARSARQPRAVVAGTPAVPDRLGRQAAPARGRRPALGRTSPAASPNRPRRARRAGCWMNSSILPRSSPQRLLGVAARHAGVSAT